MEPAKGVTEQYRYPDAAWVAMGLEMNITYKRMAEIWEEETGTPVSEGHLRNLAVQAHLTKPRVHYDFSPASQTPKQLGAYNGIMLRLLYQRQRGRTLGVKDEIRVNSWLRRLREGRQVIIFVRDDPVGWVKRPWAKFDLTDLPEFPYLGEHDKQVGHLA